MLTHDLLLGFAPPIGVEIRIKLRVKSNAIKTSRSNCKSSDSTHGFEGALGSYGPLPLVIVG
jgi:hypothetical protein